MHAQRVDCMLVELKVRYRWSS